MKFFFDYFPPSPKEFRSAFSIMFLPILFLALLLCSCDSHKQEKKSVEFTQRSMTPKLIFTEPIEAHSFELASGALTVWRKYSHAKPTLLLFASHPLLNPINQTMELPINTLLTTATDIEVLRRGCTTAADALIASPQTVSAAINANLIGELVVILPAIDDKPLALDKFKARAVAAEFLSEDEASKLTLQDSFISGSVRGIPLKVAYQGALPPIDRPLLVHIDLSYFKDRYINDIKTPIYDLIHGFATDMRKAGYRPGAVTMSLSNQEVGISLSSRFVIRDLATLVKNPSYLDGGPPASWSLRSSSLYASLMFDEERSRQLIEQAATATPDDAAALFDLALIRFQQNLPDDGFALLERAVAIDKGYALVYTELAEQGQNMGQWNKSFELLQKAIKAFPDDAVLRIRLAGDMISRGQVKDARKILATLKDLPWSDYYHPDAKKLLKEMQNAASVESVLPLADTPAAPQGKPRSRSLPPSHMGMPPR